MADDSGLSFKLAGVDELRKAMKDISVKIRTKAIRGGLREAGKVIQVAARAAAPVLSAPTITRTPGTVRRNIAVRASKFASQRGDEGVFVGVRPASDAKFGTVVSFRIAGKKLSAKYLKRASQRGARSPTDPFYWRFIEFGTRKMVARPFLAVAFAQKGREAVDAFMRTVVPLINRLNSSKD